MKFVSTAQLVQKAYKEHYAVPAFCAWNAEMVDVILQTAEKFRSPVIILSAWLDFGLIPPATFSKVAAAVAEKYTIPAALHLDHGQSLDQAKDCIAAQYTGVMVDYSSKPFDENLRILKETTRLAHAQKIAVEGEIGHVGRIDDTTPEGADEASLTDPDEAAQYARETGVDMVAVAIGNIHGSFKGLPKLDFARLDKINQAVGLPLVLHGGSGTPEEDLKKCIQLGITKVNVASELVNCFRDSLLSQWQSKKNLWVPVALAEGIQKIPPILEKWMYKLDSVNKA